MTGRCIVLNKVQRFDPLEARTTHPLDLPNAHQRLPPHIHIARYHAAQQQATQVAPSHATPSALKSRHAPSAMAYKRYGGMHPCVQVGWHSRVAVQPTKQPACLPHPQARAADQ